MSRSFENFKTAPVNGASSEGVPTGIVITDGKREIFIKKAFVSAFGYEDGSKKKVPLNPDVFHQTINNELVRRQKGKEKKREICLLGPNSNRMGRNNANSFITLMNEFGLLKNMAYEVVSVSRAGR